MVAAIRTQKLLILGGAVVGILAWVGPYPAIALALLMPSLWAAAESRWVAGLAVLGYQLGATWGLPGGVMTFYGPQRQLHLPVDVNYTSPRLAGDL